jgi:hypothetical protein
MLFTNGGTCLFDIIHSALWGSEYLVCTPDAQGVFVYWSGPVPKAFVYWYGWDRKWNYPTVGPQSGGEPFVYSGPFQYRSGPVHTNKRTHPQSSFLVGHVYCICNITQYRLSLAEYRQPKLPSSNQLYQQVLRHLSKVVKNPLCSGFKPGTSRTQVRCSNHYTIELYGSVVLSILNKTYPYKN